VAGDWYPTSGDKGLEELLRRCPDLEAVFACNDPMAAGALLAARRLGRVVPETLAVVGFDDVPEAAYFYPSLTTVRQPLADLGCQAVELLIQMLSAPTSAEIGPSPIFWLHPHLIIRESTVRESQKAANPNP